MKQMRGIRDQHVAIHVTKMPAYEASGASNALIRSLAVELGRHAIQINAVSPSYIETPLFLSDAECVTEVHPERVIIELEPKIRLPRLDESKDVAPPLAHSRRVAT
jgi:NAD(P)-dependent dehydrogenase (short-subunit alcohol dehydrogenase family)